MVLGSASPRELIWVVTALLGLVCILVDLVLASREVWIHWHDPGPVRGISRSSIMKSLVLLTMIGIGLTIGLLAIQTPDPVREQLQEYQDAVADSLITYNVLLVVLIIIKDWERWYVSRWEWHSTLKSDPTATPGSSQSDPHTCQGCRA